MGICKGKQNLTLLLAYQGALEALRVGCCPGLVLQLLGVSETAPSLNLAAPPL
jgi:hypothetical protein